ncbi:hypothetical protein TNCV_363151 [Trichonephila clavipes]|nr:hypothetical protein TNCV_363151 [Trichonephila clavipes]
MDINKDGIVTKEEFMEICSKNPHYHIQKLDYPPDAFLCIEIRRNDDEAPYQHKTPPKIPEEGVQHQSCKTFNNIFSVDLLQNLAQL